MKKSEFVKMVKNLMLERMGGQSSELKFRSLYELIVCVMLSAQCTDKRVNLITPALFEAYPDVRSLAGARLASVKMLINSCSFFNNKAQNLVKMARQVCDEFGGEIPLTQRELMRLAGVGQKTANVVLIEWLGANKMAVDTHVFRVSHRLGLSNAKTPEATEDDLTRLFKSDLGKLHQAFVLFGRYTCKAMKPKCDECFLREICPSRANFV